MTDQAPELLPFADLVDKLRHLANGGAGPVNEICAKAADAIQAYRLTVGDLLDQKLATALTRPTPAERPVPQVREALEHVTELLVDTWHHEMEGNPENEIAVINARAALASERPSDAAVAWPSRDAIAKIIEDNIYRKPNGNWDGDFQDLLVAADEIRALPPDEPTRGKETP